MPISPEVLVALGPEPVETAIGRERVLEYNQLQINGFLRWIGCQPRGPSDMAMRRARSAADQT